MAVCRQALGCCREVGDRGGEAAALALLGEAYAALGEGQLAEERWHQALVLLERLGDPKAEDLRFLLAAGM